MSLPYVAQFALGTPNLVSTPSVSQFRLNSLYDPDFTGGGHQPYQYDQVQAMYGFYLVHKCDWEVTFSNSASIPGLYVGVNLLFNTGNSVSGLPFSTIVERTQARSRALPTTGSQQVVFKGSCWPWLIMGITKAQYMNELAQYAGQTINNPASGPKLEVFVLDPNAGATSTVQITTSLKYHAELYGYIAPAQS